MLPQSLPLPVNFLDESIEIRVSPGEIFGVYQVDAAHIGQLRQLVKVAALGFQLG